MGKMINDHLLSLTHSLTRLACTKNTLMYAQPVIPSTLTSTRPEKHYTRLDLYGKWFTLSHVHVSDHYDLHICALLKITIIRNQQEKAQNWIFFHCQIDVHCRSTHVIKSLGCVPRECFAYLWWKIDTLWKFVNEIYAKRIKDGNRNGKICRKKKTNVSWIFSLSCARN